MGNRHLYCQDAGAAAATAGSVLKGTWNDTVNTGDIGGLGTAPSGAATTLNRPETNASPTWDVYIASFVAGGVGRTMTLEGTVDWVLGLLASSGSALFRTKIHIWASVGDSNTVRGTLLNNFVGSSNWPTTAQGFTDGPQALSPVAIQSGDFIVVEIGYRATNSVTTSFTGTLNFGSSASSPDLAPGDTSVTVHPSFVNFSQDFLAATAPKQTGGAQPLQGVA